MFVKSRSHSLRAQNTEDLRRPVARKKKPKNQTQNQVGIALMSRQKFHSCSFLSWNFEFQL